MTGRCEARFCGAVLHVATDGNGRAIVTCPQCTRQKRGLCRDCPERTASTRHIRCGSCGLAHRRAIERRRDRADNSEMTLDERRRAQKWDRRTPEQMERRRLEARARRAANPRDELDRLHKRVYMRQHRANPDVHARELAQRRARRDRKAAA